MNNLALLALLQLTSPALPIGAYSYSEGLETLVDRTLLTNADQLQLWITESMTIGPVGIETAIVLRAHRAWMNQDWERLAYWNHWLSATRESHELQQQNWQMGRSLFKLLRDLQPQIAWSQLENNLGENCNLAIALAIAAAHSEIDEHTTLTGYLYSWASNLVSAGVKLIPLGQTDGQRLLQKLSTPIITAVDRALVVADEDLFSCNWGLALASMAHETQYSRLFRS